jgi:hypothetical protein
VRHVTQGRGDDAGVAYQAWALTWMCDRPRRFPGRTDGVHLRAQSSTSAPISVNDLGAGTTVTAVSDRTMTADGYVWPNVQVSTGQSGWVASEFLTVVPGSESLRVLADRVRLQAQPSPSASILENNLGLGTVMTKMSDQVVTADGHDWLDVQTSTGESGWVAREYQGPVDQSVAPDVSAAALGQGGFAPLGIAAALGSPLANVAANWPPLNAALTARGIGDRPVQIAALATVAVATGRFAPIAEYASGDAYEGRADLGTGEKTGCRASSRW